MKYQYTVTFDGLVITDNKGNQLPFPDVPPLVLAQVSTLKEASTQTVIKIIVLPDGTRVTVTITVNDLLAKMPDRQGDGPPQAFTLYSAIDSGSGVIAVGGGTREAGNWTAHVTRGLHADPVAASD